MRSFDTASFALKNQTFPQLWPKPRPIHPQNGNGYRQKAEVWTFGLMRKGDNF
jgi:hypothetical protein